MYVSCTFFLTEEAASTTLDEEQQPSLRVSFQKRNRVVDEAVANDGTALYTDQRSAWFDVWTTCLKKVLPENLKESA
jgi:hypothetical protein